MPIETPKKFSEIVETLNQKNTLNILPYESEEKDTIYKIVENNKDINIFIGPEGGFDNMEINLALKNNFKIVTLGKNILRVETAGIVASSVVLTMINN